MFEGLTVEVESLEKSGLGFDVVSYPDPDSHSCGWITSPLRGGDVIHPQLWESGSGYETRLDDGGTALLYLRLIVCSGRAMFFFIYIT